MRTSATDTRGLEEVLARLAPASWLLEELRPKWGKEAWAWGRGEGQGRAEEKMKPIDRVQTPIIRTVVDLKALATEIKQWHEAGQEKGVREYLEAGKRLQAARDHVPPGQWLKWLEEEAEVSQPQASRYMRLSQLFTVNSWEGLDSAALDGKLRAAWRDICRPARLEKLPRQKELRYQDQRAEEEKAEEAPPKDISAGPETKAAVAGRKYEHSRRLVGAVRAVWEAAGPLRGWKTETLKEWLEDREGWDWGEVEEVVLPELEELAEAIFTLRNWLKITAQGE